MNVFTFYDRWWGSTVPYRHGISRQAVLMAQYSPYRINLCPLFMVINCFLIHRLSYQSPIVKWNVAQWVCLSCRSHLADILISVPSEPSQFLLHTPLIVHADYGVKKQSIRYFYQQSYFMLLTQKASFLQLWQSMKQNGTFQSNVFVNRQNVWCIY